MSLSQLKLTNFRSYKQAEFHLNPGLNLVIGPNGSGKTNLLEGIYTLALTKSFRASDKDLTNHDMSYWRLEASDGNNTLALAYTNTGSTRIKKASLNKANLTLVSYVGRLRVSLFEPNDLGIIIGPPERRRQFLDYILSQVDSNYFRTLISYRKALKQRNALLSRFDITKSRDQFFAWDIKLTEFATEIYLKRQELISYINGNLTNRYSLIAGEAPKLQLKYLPSIKINSKDYASSFLESLTANLITDLAAGFTTIGPHREDFVISFNDEPASLVASRGETRTLVLALKLSEIAYIEEATGARPILLLDDVFSELDKSRRRHLVRAIKGYQSIITATEAESVESLLKNPHQIIKIPKPKGGFR